MQPLPLYFTYVKHMGRKGYPVRDGIFFLPITPRRVVSFSSSARRDRGLLRLSECRAVLARAMPSVSNLVDRQLSPCDGGVIVHTLIIRLYVLKNILSSSNPLGLQPLPLYFTCVKHRGRKGHHPRGYHRIRLACKIYVLMYLCLKQIFCPK